MTSAPSKIRVSDLSFIKGATKVLASLLPIWMVNLSLVKDSPSEEANTQPWTPPDPSTDPQDQGGDDHLEERELPDLEPSDWWLVSSSASCQSHSTL